MQEIVVGAERRQSIMGEGPESIPFACANYKGGLVVRLHERAHNYTASGGKFLAGASLLERTLT